MGFRMNDYQKELKKDIKKKIKDGICKKDIYDLLKTDQNENILREELAKIVEKRILKKYKILILILRIILIVYLILIFLSIIFELLEGTKINMINYWNVLISFLLMINVIRLDVVSFYPCIVWIIINSAYEILSNINSNDDDNYIYISIYFLIIVILISLIFKIRTSLFKHYNFVKPKFDDNNKILFE